MTTNEFDFRLTDVLLSSEKADFRRSQIKNLFHQYGLTRLETDVYLGLLEYGDSTVKELSLALELNRVEVYRVIKRLLSRGVVSVIRSEPTTYQVVRPSLAIRALIQQFETKVHQVKALAPGLILELETLEAKKKEGRANFLNGGFRIITGKATDEMTRSMFMRARSSIQGIWSLKRTKRFGLIQPFIHSVKDGVKAEVICQVTTKNIREVEDILRVAEVRHCEGAEDALRFTVVDEKEVNIQASPVDSGWEGSLSIWSDNQALIQTMVTTFRILWRHSTGSESRLAELSSEIGV